MHRAIHTLLAGVLLLSACEEATPPLTQTPAKAEALEGSGQTGPVATRLATAIAVRVVDSNGYPLRNVPVEWSMSAGSGALNVLDPTTDRVGLSRAEWTVGTQAGTHTAIAAIAGLPPVTFTARAIPGPAASIRLSRDSLATRSVGDTARIVATVSDRYGNLLADQSVTYASANAAIATVSNAGLVTTRGRGSTTITVASGSASATFRIRVTEIARVTITSGPVSFTYLNETRQLSARAEDAQGVPFGDLPITWTSGNPGVIEVSSSGSARAVGNGSTQITGSIEGVQASVAGAVSQVVTGILITPSSPSVGVGATVQLNATARDAGGSIVPSQLATWSIANATVATINSASGLVGGLSRGRASVTARIGAASASTELEVTAAMNLIAGGEGHSCALGAISTTRTTILCWGDNQQGRLGTGDETSSTAAVPVSSGLQFSRMAVGGAHSCGLAGGLLLCWGYGGLGQLGHGSAENRIVPVSTSPLGNVAQVSAGQLHTCAVTTTNQPYCWGSNQTGQLGVGTATGSCGGTACELQPTPVSGGLQFRLMAAGARHTCAIQTPSGAVYCWGSNSSGQLGTNNTTSSTVPVPVSSTIIFNELAAGEDFTCGLTGDGRAYCWGRNASGQLGIGNSLPALVPTSVLGGLSFVQIAAGSNHACGRTGAGQIWCWGANGSGELGNGTQTAANVPVLVQAPELTFVALGAGGQHTCGVSAERVAYCWGFNNSGQLGDGTTGTRLVPTRVR